MSVAAKMSLRRAVKLNLRQLENSSISAQSTTILNDLKKNQQFQNAQSVALFMNMPSLEVETLPIIELCFSSNKKVYLPKCLLCNTQENSMTFLQVSSLDEVNALTPVGKYNLREPSHGEDVLLTGMLDMIIVPGVAFTHLGDRLGHGAGYYDRFLSKFKARFGRIPYLIGICLTKQLVESLPTEAHDWKMDEVIAPRFE